MCCIRLKSYGTSNQATLPLCSVSNTQPTKLRTGHHPGRYRASRISNRRLPIGHVASPPTAGRFTSYAEPPGPAQFPAACSVTMRHCGFQQPERRSSRLHVDMNRSRFGTVSDGTNQQALTSLLWLSYLSSGFVAGSPSRSRPGRARRRAANSPRWPG
jgi:hypothetical protein